MNEVPKPVEEELVSCEVCLKEIPLSESKSTEAVDYVVHFCGLQCHSKWKEQQSKPDA
ncbi:MAG: DUF3330 domain-containing protein [Sulfuricellaceae bacterium]|nr:DUF3330 domain-containing protein [Sulfuricellaceae bacterium]